MLENTLFVSYSDRPIVKLSEIIGKFVAPKSSRGRASGGCLRSRPARSLRILRLPMRLPGSVPPIRIEFNEAAPQNVDFRNSLSQNTGFLKSDLQKHA